MECELSQNYKTCEAIIRVIINYSIESDDLFRTIIDEAESCEHKGRIVCARTL